MKQQSLHGFCATLAFVAASATLAQDKPVTVNLEPQNASGEQGTVTLTPQGDKTQVVIKLAGAPSGVQQPAHIHDGNCAIRSHACHFKTWSAATPRRPWT
jgi:Cu/Zn superoxide dismutase